MGHSQPPMQGGLGRQGKELQSPLLCAYLHKRGARECFSPARDQPFAGGRGKDGGEGRGGEGTGAGGMERREGS